MCGPSPCCCLRHPPSFMIKICHSNVQTFRAVLAANLFLLLPLTAATYHLPLLLTTYRCHLPPGLPSTVGIATRRPIPTSPRFAFGFLLLSYDPLWFLSPLGPRSLVLCGSLHHLTPRRGGRSVSAAPSSLPLFLHKAVVSRTLPKYFIRLPVMGIRFILSDLGTAPFRSCFRLIQPKINSSGLLPDITKRC